MGLFDFALDKLKPIIFDQAVDVIKEGLWEEFGDEIEEIFEDVDETQARVSVIAAAIADLDPDDHGLDDELVETLMEASEYVDSLQEKLLDFFGAEVLDSDEEDED